MIKNILFFAGLILLLPGIAHGYLDPGTASFITQIIIATFATFLLSIKIFWRKIKNLFRKNEEGQ